MTKRDHQPAAFTQQDADRRSSRWFLVVNQHLTGFKLIGAIRDENRWLRRPAENTCTYAFCSQQLNTAHLPLQCLRVFNQIHGALFPPEEADALIKALGRDEEMRQKAEQRQALKRQQFEDSMVRSFFG